VLYHLSKPAPDGRLVLKLQPLELIDTQVIDQSDRNAT